MKISRRNLLAAGLTAGLGVAVGGYAVYRMGTSILPEKSLEMSEVFMVGASNRMESIRKLLGRFDSSRLKI